MMAKYFFDTYALVEIIKNNPAYVKYFEEIIITTKYNLIELYYSLLMDFGEEKAKAGYLKFKDSSMDINDGVIFEAMQLKLKNKKLSYVDCIGYICATSKNLLFLTGDKEFEKMNNVEFVKKDFEDFDIPGEEP